MRPLSHLGLAALFALTTVAYSQQTSAAPQTGAQSGTPADPQASSVAGSQTANQTSATPATSTDSDKPKFGVSNDTSAKPNDSSATQDTAATPDTDKAGSDKTSTSSKSKPDSKSTAAKTDVLPSPGEALDPHIKKGSEDDVDAIGTRNIGGRGLGNWYSTNWEIGTGKQYSMEIEKSAHLITDPVIVEYINRVGQNIVKNSDCKVPFTIKIIDSDEINAMALPGGFFYVNSGLILAADEEAELAGVMAHETAHVCAHHAARQQTKMNYMQIGEIPILILTQGTWTGYGIY
jgi:beta-barrel assembly-enhancing protease